MNPEPLAPVQSPDVAGRSAKQCRVLFLDDEQPLLDGLARQLRNVEGSWHFDFCRDPEEALHRIVHRRYDIVVSDMCMPGMRGDEWLGQVHDLSPDTVRIALSGKDDRTTTMAALNGGHVFHFLTKPCPRDELLRVLELARRQHDLASGERELLRLQLEHAERVATVGRFTAGIVHDLNNFVGVILNASNPRSGFKSDEALELVHANARRMCELTSELMAFCRRDGNGDMQVVEISSVIQSSARLLGPALLRSVNLEIAVAEKLPPVLGRPSELKQMLTNLVLNARDAMPTGGRVTVRAEPGKRMASGAVCTKVGSCSGPICISVSDQGCGMDEATRRRLFEPFFTTKPDGKGTGLGLALVKQIVDRHRGTIEVDTVPGVGTTFRIHLPAASADEIAS